MLALYAIEALVMLIFSASPDSPKRVFNMCIVVAPSIGLFDTLLKMIQNKSNKHYNRHASILQIISNFLRFVYWWYVPVTSYLLHQSILCFSIHFIMSILAFFFTDSKPLRLSMSDLHRYRHSQHSYLNIMSSSTLFEFVVGVTIYMSTIFIIFQASSMIIGRNIALTAVIVASNALDATKSVPHFIQVVIKGEWQCVSFILVIQYIIGDVMKLVLYVLGRAGAAFIIGSVVQLVMDTILVVSYICQRKSPEEKSESVPLLNR